jgi:hypothetical protein
MLFQEFLEMLVWRGFWRLYLMGEKRAGRDRE